MQTGSCFREKEGDWSSHQEEATIELIPPTFINKVVNSTKSPTKTLWNVS